MVFFKSVFKAFEICVFAGFLFLVLGLFGIQLFSSRINTIPGFLLFFFLVLGYVLWVKY